MHDLTTTMHRSPGLRLLSMDPWSAPAGRDFPRHVHTCWEIHYYRTGTITSLIAGQRHPAWPGVITAVPPGSWHGELAHTAYENYWVQIDGPADQPRPIVSADDENVSIGQVIHSLLREYQAQAADRDEMQRLLIAQLDIHMRRTHAQASPSRAKRLVREAEWTMSERLSRPVSIEEIAGLVGVSTSRLRAAFAECRGRSPLTVLHEMRADHAVRLIQSVPASAATLDAIACSCGYDSARHLSRHVRRRTGMSPGRLRQDNR